MFCAAAVFGTAFETSNGIVYVKGRGELEIVQSHCVIHVSLSLMTG